MSKTTSKAGTRGIKNLTKPKTKRGTKIIVKDSNNDGIIDEIEYKTVLEIPSPKKSTGKGKKVTEDVIEKDLNGDGLVDEIDYKMVTKKLSSKKSMSKEKIEIVEKDIDGDGLVDEIIVKKSTKKSVGKGPSKNVTIDTEIEEFMMGKTGKKSTKKSIRKSNSNLEKIAVINNSGKVVPRSSMNKKSLPLNDVTEIPSLLVTIPYMEEDDSNFHLASIKSPVKILTTKEAEIFEHAHEKELSDLGYRSMGLHLVSQEKCYVKTVNDNGQKVFVCMDKINPPPHSGMIMMETDHHSNIPYSIKHGTMETVGTALHSVAFECVNGVCMLSKNHDMDPMETNYGNMDALQIENGTKDTVIIPVLTIEEIRNHPKEVLHTTNEMTRKLRNNTYQYEVKELDAYLCSAKNLVSSIEEFDAMRLKISEQILDSLTLLEDWNDIYKSNPPTTAEGIKKYKLLIHNLAYRNNAIDTLLSMMNKVNESKALIDRAIMIIKNSTEHGYKEFTNIDSTLVE